MNIKSNGKSRLNVGPLVGREEASSHGIRFLRRPVVLFCLGSVLMLAYPNELAAQTDCVPSPLGLVSWWRGEGNATDWVGGNDGTPQGTVDYGPGEVGQGFVLPGVSGITVGSATNLQLQNFTIECWIKRGNLSRASAGQYSQGVGYFFGFGGGGYGFGINDYGTLFLSQVGVSAEYASNVSISDMNFHHVAVTEGSGTVVFYVDGIPYPAPPYGPAFSFTSIAAIGMPGLFGNIPNATFFAYWGTIDELSIYNRALSEAEIQAVYGAGSHGKCLELTNPYIFAQPTNEAIVPGNQALFAVDATGAAPLAYQWKFDGSNIAGATASTLSITNAQLSQTGNYRVFITNSYASFASSEAVLLVEAPPAITNQPQSRAVASGTNVTFSVTATGTALSYQWFVGNSPIENQTNSALLLTNVNTNNTGLYYVIISNAIQVLTSVPAILTVLTGPPAIVRQPESQSVWGGTAATLSLAATGGGVAATPPEINSGTLQLWLAADSGIVANAEGQVSRWLDQSGNQNDAVQTNQNQQPLLVYPAPIGGLPAIMFNGIQGTPESEFLYGPRTVGIPNSMTAFMLYQANSTTNAEEVPFFVGIPGDAGDGRGDYLASGQMAFTTGGADYNSGYVIPTGTYRIWTDRFDTNQNLLELFDDTLQSSTNFDLSAVDQGPPGPGYYIGGLDASGQYVSSGLNFGGHIAELLIYSGALSDADRLAVVYYLKQKYFQINGPGLTFQWQHDGTNLIGATNASLTITDVQQPEAGSYLVVVRACLKTNV
jgi:hypothetical protein